MANVIKDLAVRPTHVTELVQQGLDYAGYCDASAFGAGGVWFGSGTALPRSVWRIQLPQDITSDVVSYANPNGRLTNSDLEMAAVVLQQAVLEARLGSAIAGTQAAIGSDNPPSGCLDNTHGVQERLAHLVSTSPRTSHAPTE